MMIGSIKIFIGITVLLALYPEETKANKDHPNVRRNDASSDPTSRRLSTDDIISITSPGKPTSTEKGSNKKISNVLKDLINKKPISNGVKDVIRLVENDKKVLVDVVGTKIGFDQALVGIAGIDIISCYEKSCSMYIPISKINELASYSQVASIRASMPRRNVGDVTSEGVIAMEVDKAVAKYNVNGTGLMIGVMSDSFNCLGNAVLDSASGDLPPVSNIIILGDLFGYECYDAIDEGRAMMQLIHDVAPGAKLAFYTAYRGEADFANGIVQLANAGCDIIVDDVYYFDEPFFQDGILSQAIEQVAAQGVSYFTSAGNSGDDAWDAPNGFVGSGRLDIFGNEYHQFSTDSTGQPIITQRVGFPNDYRDYYVVFQWDEPSFSQSAVLGTGSTSDVDIFFINKGEVVASGIDFNVGYDPIEIFYLYPGYVSSNDPVIYLDMVIKLYDGPAPKLMKLMIFGGNEDIIYEFGIGSYPTAVGHHNSASGVSVGAAFYENTPVFGTSPPTIESFSSRGGTPVVIDKDGVRQTQQIRSQPLVTGPDGVSTTFFPPYSSDYRFYGTSASAPHVAAVVALLLQAKGGRKSLSPSELSKVLKDTAIDMDDPSTVTFDVGFDYKTGYGFVNALAALDKLLPATNCVVTWNLYNSQTDKLNAKLVDGTTIATPPPCTRTNIEAVVPCGLANGKPVVIELYKDTGNVLFHKRTENVAAYFLYGNNGANAYDGRIPPGTYSIRAKVNDKYTPKTTFTLQGGVCG